MKELIVGGDFQSPGITSPSGFQIFSSYGDWFGNEIEIGEESLFFSGGSSSNLVLELDGNSGATSVVQQTFDVEGNNQEATLSFDLGARNTGGINADPVLVEVLDASNTVIFTQTVTPTSAGSFDNFQFNFVFASVGTYTLRFTEGGPDNSLGAILDNISLMVCFVSGTPILTPDGERLIDDLRVGDLVSTMDGPAKPIVWLGSKRLCRAELQANPKMRPVLIARNALGEGMPSADLVVSPQHRILVRSKVAKRVLGEAEVLVPAKKLLGLPGVDVLESCEAVSYFHFALEEHSIVVAQQAYTESLYVGAEARKMLDSDALEELNALFPGHFDGPANPRPARPLHSHKKLVDRLCQRLVQNQKPAVDMTL